MFLKSYLIKDEKGIGTVSFGFLYFAGVGAIAPTFFMEEEKQRYKWKARSGNVKHFQIFPKNL